MKEEAIAWLKQAEEDLEKAKILLDNKKFDGVAFYSQQTAEKTLKAVIIEIEGKLAKIHDLVILGRMVNLPKTLLKKCEVLSKTYIESRYGILDNEIPAKKFKESDASEFVKIAKEILEWAKKI